MVTPREERHIGLSNGNWPTYLIRMINHLLFCQTDDLFHIIERRTANVRAKQIKAAKDHFLA